MSDSSSQFKKLLTSKYTYIVIILIISVGVYLNTLSNGFVYDDEFQVVENPWIKDVKYIPEMFTSEVWAFEGRISNYYRPLMHIILMLDYYIFGLKPWGFHLINIIFHAGVSILVFLIAFILFNKLQTQQQSDLSPNTYNLLPAFIAAIFFATHPIHTEVVAWISGIPELSFTAFYLLSFYFYIKADGKYGKYFIFSILFFFLSTLCKETAITLPILLFAYDYSLSNSLPSSRPSPLWGEERVKGLKRYLLYLIVAGMYFLLRTYAIGGFASLKRHAELSSYEYFINIFPLFIQYLEKLFLPINLNAFYVLHPISSILEWKGIITIILTLLFIFFVYLFRRMNRTAFFSLIWIVVPLLPVFYIPALGDATFAERYLYLPSVGFVILASTGIERIYQLKVLRKATVFAISVILIITTGLYSVGTIMRSAVWKDNYSLWTNTIKKSLDGYIPHINLGDAYFKLGRLEEAIEEYQKAIRLKPDDALLYYTLGLVYDEMELKESAIREFKEALRIRPGLTDARQAIDRLHGKP